MPILEADALAIHNAIHGEHKSVTLASGETLAVETNPRKLRLVKVAGMSAMEQNKAKPSEWAKKAKDGAKITWFLCGGSPSTWGRIVDGVVEANGSAISDGLGAGESAKAATKKRPAAALEETKVKSSKVEAPVKKTKVVEAAKTMVASTSCSATPATPFTSDILGLSPLFDGSGHGRIWEAILRPVIEGLPEAAKFIGPSRDKRMVPVRELTFQALKPNPPSGWKVVSFGQSPYPRIESATGIAHFDNTLRSWDDKRFSQVTSMKCIVKAAAISKLKASRVISVPELREMFKEHRIVGPAEWFQAILAQGVLLMNAACTILPPEEKGVRAGSVVDEHTKFWQPLVESVVDAILTECRRTGQGIVFSWWGSESLKTKRALGCLRRYPDVRMEHIEHKHPAAYRDEFCDDPNVFERINKALVKLDLDPIDWLPSAGWESRLSTGSSAAAQMGEFIAETQNLHKMYLDRLKDGLDDMKRDDFEDIVGIMCRELVELTTACEPMKLEKPAEASSSKARSMSRGDLSVDEAAALHFYTTNYLYKRLNEALRSKDRVGVEQYFLYLRLFLSALNKLPSCKRQLYRGVALDLSSQYKANAVVTWWAVSSCSPDLKVANMFKGSTLSTLFIINAQTSVGIRDFSEYKTEEEFILAPGTQFKITKVEHKGKQIEVHMEELDGPKRVR